MDTKQIEYILKIAEENNITKAAEKLFLTQPALNSSFFAWKKSWALSFFTARGPIGGPRRLEKSILKMPGKCF